MEMGVGAGPVVWEYRKPGFVIPPEGLGEDEQIFRAAASQGLLQKDCF